MLAQGFGSKPDKAKKQAPRIPAASKPCPCFSGKPYEECCKPIHDGEKSPQPVEVMRARYSAFAWWVLSGFDKTLVTYIRLLYQYEQ